MRPLPQLCTDCGVTGRLRWSIQDGRACAECECGGGLLCGILDHERTAAVALAELADLRATNARQAGEIAELRKMLSCLADVAETMASSEPDMPSHGDIEREFDAALDAARSALSTPKDPP